MARLVLNSDGVDLVTHELVGDIVTIGRVPLNHIVIDHFDGISGARRPPESPQLLLPKGFELNKRDTGQWRFYY